MATLISSSAVHRCFPGTSGALGKFGNVSVKVLFGRWPHDQNMSGTTRRVPCLVDNYAYLLHDTASGTTCIVDPSAAGPVVKAFKQKGLSLDYILNTHHHWDHTGGNAKLKKKFSAKLVPPSGDLQRKLEDKVEIGSRKKYRQVDLRFDVHVQDNLNNRFKPLDGLRTNALFSIDDDVLVPCPTLEFAFSVWTSAPDNMVGFVPRMHWVEYTSKLLVSMAPINYASLFTKLKADFPVPDPETKKRRRTSTSSFYPTEAQNRLLDVCGYKDFTNSPAFDTIKEVNAFVTKYADNKKAFKDKYGAEPCPGHVKIMLDLFQIDYADGVDHLTAWNAKAMLKTVVPGDLGTHQMFRFFHEYHITDPAAWSDLSFKQATTLLEALNSEREAAAGLEALAPNPVLPNTTVGVTNVASTSRPKNGKRAASTSTQ